MSDSLRGIIEFLKSTAPVSIFTNIVIGLILLGVGLFLLLKNQELNRKKKIGGWVCIYVSVLAFLGAMSNWLFSNVIF